MYNNVAMSLPPAVQQKKKSFNIADILSDDTNQLERDIGKMASHPYYPATQQYTESAGKASIFILTCFFGDFKPDMCISSKYVYIVTRP